MLAGIAIFAYVTSESSSSRCKPPPTQTACTTALIGSRTFLCNEPNRNCVAEIYLTYCQNHTLKKSSFSSGRAPRGLIPPSTFRRR